MNGRSELRFREQATAAPWGQASCVDSAMEMHPWLALRRVAEALWNTCGAYEWVALGYLGMSSLLIVTFAENLAHPGRILAVQAMVAALVIGLCWIEARSAARASVCGKTFATKWWHFWRHWYPHLFFLFCFEELGHLMRLVKPDWQDAKLIAFDRWLTGVHPTVWLEQFATPARNDFMQFAYLTYFVYLLVPGGVLYARRDWAAYWSVMTYSMAAYSIGYLISIFFPIESPWFSMTGSWTAPLAGGPFTAAINFIEHFGRVRGAAFPSEHVAGATAALWGAWKHRRWLFRVMAPLVFLMCISTVWGRYHYVADVLGGLVTGTLGYFIGAWLMRRKGAVAVLGCDQHGRVQSRKSSFGRAFQEDACSKWSANSSKAASPASTPMN